MTATAVPVPFSPRAPLLCFRSNAMSRAAGSSSALCSRPSCRRFGSGAAPVAAASTTPCRWFRVGPPSARALPPRISILDAAATTQDLHPRRCQRRRLPGCRQARLPLLCFVRSSWGQQLRLHSGSTVLHGDVALSSLRLWLWLHSGFGFTPAPASLRLRLF